MINMINKISSKLLMLLVLLVAQVSVAFAQVKITMDDLDIYAGEEQTVAVSMENAGEEKLIALQFELTLPTGLTIEGTDKDGSEVLQRIHFVQYQRNWNKEGNVYTVVIASSNNTAFKTNAGKFFNLKVKAAAGYLGAGTIEIAGVEGSDTNREPVAGEGGTAASIAATFGAETAAFETYPTQEFEVNITLDNSTVFRDFQFNLTLPKGLELVEGEDGFFGYTDRIPADAALAPQLNGNYYKVACVSPSAGLVDDGKGKFFSFKVKATTALAAEDSIVLNNFVISDRNANAYELDDEIVVKVTNLNEPAKIEADSVVAALQAEYDSTMVKIAADCKDVAESEAVVAEADSVQKLITDLQAAVDAAYAAGTLPEFDNAEAVKGIADATSKMLENATAAQKAFDEAVAANAAQYAADTLAVDAAQAALDAVKAEIEGYDESVKAAVADAIAAAQAAVDAAQAAADKSFAAGTSVADAVANAELVAAANAAAEKLAADAAAAQKEFEDSQVDPNKPVAPELTATSPLVTDGSVAQYLYNVEAKAFLVGANDWGTRASFSATKGYPVKMTLNEDGATYTFADQLPNGNWNSLDCQGVDQIWVDGAGRGGDKMWTVAVAEDGSFTIANNNVPNGNLSAVPSKNDTRLYISDAEEAQDVWVAVSEEDYKAYIEAYNKYLAELDAYNKQNYKVGDDIIAFAPASWASQTGNYGGLANPSSELYNSGGSVGAGDVMTQTLENLKTGMYEVTMGLAVSYTSGRGFECPVGEGLSVGFVNDQETGLTVVDRGWVAEGEQTTVKLTAAVVDGTLKYGIKNLVPSGNWYVANVLSIVYVSDQIYSDLSASDYYRWTAADATGVQERIENTSLSLGTSTGLVYGDGNVYYLNYADLSDAKTLVAVATEGEPRFLFNRVEDNGNVNAELPRDAAKYETVVDNGDGSKTYTINIAAIVEEFGFAHLHAIKGANWANTTVTSLKVGKVVKPVKNYSIDVERYPGMGYGPTTATADLAEALSFLGVEAATAEMLSIVNPDGTEVSDYATYDGWFAADGTANTWGDNSKVCVKFFQALSSGQFEICDMNGADVVGTTYTVKFALKANDKTAIYTINVKFVEKPAIYLADYTAKAETVELKIAAQDAEGNWAAESATEAINVADITALVGENYVVYGVGAKDGDKETLTNSYSCTPHPGFWCLADGTADVWANSTFGVSFYAAEGVFKTWTKAAVTEDLSTTFYFVNEEAKEYVAYKVVLCAPVAEEPEIGTVIHTIDFTTQESYPYYVMTAPAGSSFDVIDGALVIENTVEQANFWDLQPFVCDWFSLKAGYDYIVRITMKADTDGSATIGMGTWSASMSKQLEFTAGTEYQKYNVEFPASTVESANNDVHVLFQAGKYIGKVEIAKVEIIEIVPVGIETPETAAPAAQKNGKFLENGKIVIIKNGQKYSTSGSIIK